MAGGHADEDPAVDFDDFAMDYGLWMDKIWPIGEVSNGVYGRETAEIVHKKLREVGGVKVPREFVFMDRAALGLGSVFLHLKAEINWYRVFNELIEGFDEKKMGSTQKDALKKFSIPVGA